MFRISNAFSPGLTFVVNKQNYHTQFLASAFTSFNWNFLIYGYCFFTRSTVCAKNNAAFHAYQAPGKI
jgi:hypothetical protein